MYIKKTMMLTSAVVLLVLLAYPFNLLADTGPSRPNGLPAGTGAGLTTSVGFQPSWQGRYRFYGIRIEWVDPYVTRVKIRQQFGQRRVIYDGPVRAGQFIAFPDTHIVWTGYRSQRGSHMGGVRVLARYR